METSLSPDYDSYPFKRSGHTQATLVTDMSRTLIPGYVASHVGGEVLGTSERKCKTASQGFFKNPLALECPFSHTEEQRIESSTVTKTNVTSHTSRKFTNLQMKTLLCFCGYNKRHYQKNKTKNH